MKKDIELSIRIRNLNFKYGLFLAPMAGVTDRAYRNICRKHGAEMTATEMVSAKALHYNDDSSLLLGSLREDETNTAVQIFGHEEEIMVEAIKKLTAKREGFIQPVCVDVNMGCPMKKIVNNGDGSALMKNPEAVRKIVRAVRASTDMPFTVKIRCGWDDNSINAPLIAKIAEENGADAVCVHGRTREMMYCTEVLLSVIADVKRAVNIPVIGNGGINTAQDALTMLDATKCDGLMLARGTMGNPWLFEEIKAALDGTAYVLPDLDIRLNEALVQVKEMIDDKGERTGVLEARRQLAYYIKNVKGSAEARGRLNNAQSYEELVDIVEKFIKK